MTRKEKKELALRIKAEIEAKKPQTEKVQGISQKVKDANNRRRAGVSKARQMKTIKQFKPPNLNHLDFDKW